MIRVEVQPSNSTGHFTVRTRDGDNGKIMLSSTSQLYTNRNDAIDIARRHFPPVSPTPPVVGEVEPVYLVVLSAEGSVELEEQLR